VLPSFTFIVHQVQVFARKILPIHHNFAKYELQNELRVIDKLCREGGHENIVSVLRHGFLHERGHYFIDMEFCGMNLRDYIYRMPSDKLNAFPPSLDSLPTSLKELHIWTIMKQIVSGLQYLHSHGEVHRDLKSSNSTPLHVSG